MIKNSNNIFFKNFVLKLLAFFAVVFLVDAGIGYFLKKYYYKQQSGYDYLTTNAIENAKADIMVFGSSRAVNIFNPEIIESKTGLSCFNVGRVGEPVFYHEAVLKSVLKRFSPKLIILSIDAGNFSNGLDAYDRLTALLPYYNAHPEIRPIVQLKGPFEQIKMISHIYPYNSLLIPIITGNTAYSKRKYPHIKGFIPLTRTFSGPLRTFDYAAEKELDTVKINAYKSFIEDCIQAKIPLHIVVPPYLIHAIGVDSSITEAKKIAESYKINFLDYSRDSFFVNKPDLFADYRHLNVEGVKVFSDILLPQIYPAKN